jgi:hypothetical protein
MMLELKGLGIEGVRKRRKRVEGKLDFGDISRRDQKIESSFELQTLESASLVKGERQLLLGGYMNADE